LSTLAANPLTAKIAGEISIVRISVAVRSLSAESQPGTSNSVSGRASTASRRATGAVTATASDITLLVKRQASSSSSRAK
jgi:hypothetical protein